MDEIAGSLGAVICRSAVEIGFSPHCFEQSMEQRLGYILVTVLLLIVTFSLQRFGRWA